MKSMGLAPVWPLIGALASHCYAVSPPLMVTDNLADRIMLFDGDNGSLIDGNWITDAEAGGRLGSPKEAAVVGQQIWVSDVDRVLRFDASGVYAGQFSTFNIGGQGFGVSGTSIYLAGTGTLRGIHRYNYDGVRESYIGDITVYDAEPFQGGLLASTVNGLRKYSLFGEYFGEFATGIGSPRQVVVNKDGSVLATASTVQLGAKGVYHFRADGSELAFVNIQALEDEVGKVSPRGAWLLGDGGYLIATSNGVYKATASGGKYVFSRMANADAYSINEVPAPGALPPFLGLAMLSRRRR